MGYTDSTSSSAQTANSNSKHNPSSARHGGLWEDPAIVAARIPMSRITIGDVISRGGFGEVLRGIYKKRDVAIKRLLPETRKDVSRLKNFWLKDLCVVSEFMDGGDLRALLVKFDEVDHRPLGFDAVKARIVLDVAHALTYLHSLEAMVHLGTACVAFDPDERPTASQALYQMQLVMRAFAQEEAEESYVF
ncbi:unnamed protein product [Peronospora destructor]|uniref:Protein kinase domain-containing protein n=1 Tax=Peronospora destructor TaxID=86335 RepID=A0AAV0SYJ3_9STRA|nr:unnamed protein product [Peronospora destructor]